MSRREEELEAQREAAFANRRFDPESYEKDLTPELPPELQVAIAAGELHEIDDPTVPTQQAQDEFKRQKAKSDEMAREFMFLDPEDYSDHEARKGRVLHLRDLIKMLMTATGKVCYYSLANEAMVAKELSPRDIALAKVKIGEDPRNVYDIVRWRDAIAEVRQEQARKVPLRPYKLFAIQICRCPDKPEYCCWVPAHEYIREYDLVQFDDHGVPQEQIRGWRTVLIEAVRKGFATEQEVDQVFGAPTNAISKNGREVSKRYKMVMQSLRAGCGKEDAGPIEASASSGSVPAVIEEVAEEVVAPCLECHRRVGHFAFCSQYVAWYQGVGEAG